MSTYLVAFVVCDFSKITNKTSRGVSVSVYAPPDQITQASFALDVATKVMDFYEDFFGVPYPLPKLGKYPIWYLQIMLILVSLETEKFNLRKYVFVFKSPLWLIFSYMRILYSTNIPPYPLWLIFCP